jgi:hypothetical protein
MAVAPRGGGMFNKHLSIGTIVSIVNRMLGVLTEQPMILFKWPSRRNFSAWDFLLLIMTMTCASALHISRRKREVI